MFGPALIWMNTKMGLYLSVARFSKRGKAMRWILCAALAVSIDAAADASKEWVDRLKSHPYRLSTHNARQVVSGAYECQKSQNVPASLVMAVANIESHFKPDAVSTAKAYGVMQVRKFWIKEMSRLYKWGSSGVDLKDIRTNIRYGCAIIRHYLNTEIRLSGGKISDRDLLFQALSRYNGSRGEVRYPKKVMSALEVWSVE
jgi:soluble lytic murein transglycosylase-like protein